MVNCVGVLVWEAAWLVNCVLVFAWEAACMVNRVCMCNGRRVEGTMTRQDGEEEEGEEEECHPVSSVATLHRSKPPRPLPAPTRSPGQRRRRAA